MSRETALVTAELLRLFVLEVRQRASILAECEDDLVVESTTPTGTGTTKNSCVSIRSDHVSHVAADLLMDYS